ncbi:MAG: glycosyltransferase family 2 protein [Xanthomonadales bacterium]|nr:glycosyltransferase family 2 protein [Xanthomonadales bacterium]
MSEATGLVSVVIPVYNGAATIGELAERLLATFRRQSQDCEIIMVNDGSQDDSWATITALAANHPEVTGLNLLRNFGQHNALLAGIRRARGTVIVTMDDDLQNPPEEVPKLLAKVAEGHAVVYGVPGAGRHGIFRDFASFAAKFALRVGLGFKHARHTSAFRAFKAPLRDAFADFGAKYVSIDVLLTWATTDFSWVVVDHKERDAGKSGYTLRKLLSHTLNMVTSFSSLPLRLASLIGFVFMVFGIMVLLYSLGVYLFRGQVVPGFTFLASIIAIFSGVQLFSLGIIGEYIGRIHQRVLDQPCYVIDETTPGRDEVKP